MRSAEHHHCQLAVRMEVGGHHRARRGRGRGDIDPTLGDGLEKMSNHHCWEKRLHNKATWAKTKAVTEGERNNIFRDKKKELEEQQLMDHTRT